MLEKQNLFEARTKGYHTTQKTSSAHRVVLRADLMNETHIERLRAACRGWADFRRVAEAAPIEDVEAEILAAQILVGWAPVKTLVASSIQYYLCGSAGYDAYQGAGLESKPGFVITNAAGTMGIPIAEHALAFMFMASRQLHRHVRQQRQGVWSRIFDGGELCGATVCIVGLGGAGRELARRCRALGMRVIGVRRTPGPDVAVDALFAPGDLALAVAGANHVVSCLPGGRETARVFNAAIFAAMKPGSAFHVVSRGSVIDFPALEQALVSGHLGFAGLDVSDPEPPAPESPLWDLPNVLFTSHSAGWSPRLPDRLCDLFVENLENLRDGQPLRNVVKLG
jgi:D-2-hydroxyacid dehydrogenase (NADP+)